MDRRSFLRVSLSALALPVFTSLGQGAQVRKYAEDLQNNEYNWFPERSLSGPLLIIVSIPDQKVHVYRNGIRIAASTCTTGKPGHKTPTGVFKILQKDKYHHSNIYNNASMPNMQRLTWSGIALHAGNLPGYPASHGCVRLPMGFSELLFGITRKGMTVVIADNRSNSSAVVHPKLILSDDARSKFNAVDSNFHSAARDVERNQDLAHTSVVVSGKDRRATLYENDQIVARARIDIADPKRPLDNAAYQLLRSNAAKQEMHWSQIAFDKGKGSAGKSDLPRIKAPAAFADEVHRRAHKGMTLVTTADVHRPRHRADDGFMVFDGLY